ncbi:hypothetical protein [Nocardia asteroides]|uniref:hypothetical protein n=1 Tax=Nocardia asteroides TaxID=1824 RepID=UPI0033C95D13
MRDLPAVGIVATCFIYMIAGVYLGANPAVVIGPVIGAVIVTIAVRAVRQRARIRRFHQHRAAGRYPQAAQIAQAMISQLADGETDRTDTVAAERQRADLYGWYLNLSYVQYEAGDRAAVDSAAVAVAGMRELFGPWHPDTITAQHFHDSASTTFTTQNE